MRIDRFDYGRLHSVQQARLGIGYTDENGERWGYVRIRQAIGYGEVVRGAKHADLVGATEGDVSAVSPVGSDILTTVDGFAVSGVTRDLRGCLGYISDGGGIGQQFYILENTDDVAKVFVLTGNTNRAKSSGWVTALSTASQFWLFFPGEAYQGDGTSDLIEGIMQAPGGAGSDDLGKFCWVKRSGVTPVIVDGGGTDLTSGGQIVPTTAGQVQGSTNSTHAIGRALAATDYGGAEDYLALTSIDIPDGPLSYAYANVQNGYNEVTIR